MVSWTGLGRGREGVESDRQTKWRPQLVAKRKRRKQITRKECDCWLRCCRLHFWSWKWGGRNGLQKIWLAFGAWLTANLSLPLVVVVFVTSLSRRFCLVVCSAGDSSGNVSALLLTRLPVNTISYSYKYPDVNFPREHTSEHARLASVSLTATFWQPTFWPWSVPRFFGGLKWGFTLLFATPTKIWLVKNLVLPVIILGVGGKLFWTI